MGFLHQVDKMKIPLDDSLVVIRTQNGEPTDFIDSPLV
jgi:hypothetical protein